MDSKIEKPEGYAAFYKGVVQNGLFALDLDALTLIVHELIEEGAAFDCMESRNGWQVRPVKLVFLDE